MTEREYRQDDLTIGYCPICGQTCTDTMMDGGGWCPDHGRVWVNWSPRIRTEPKTTAGGSREGGTSDPRPDPRTHPEYWTE